MYVPHHINFLTYTFIALTTNDLSLYLSVIRLYIYICTHIYLYIYSVVENVSDDALGEVQLTTELCNYKICRYLASACMLSDALLQFEEHVAAVKGTYMCVHMWVYLCTPL